MVENYKIKSIKAREILDSRGSPTVEVDLQIDLGTFRASVPSGASTGKHEAVELRDGGKRYQGKGVLKAIDNISKKIQPELIGKDVTCQKEIDDLMIQLDGTKNKSCLGANAIVGVSIAVCRAGAAVKNTPLFNYIAQLAKNNSPLFLPFPCFNIINGGAHAGNELDIQEFMVVPKSKTYSEKLQAGLEIYYSLKEILKKRFGKSAINIGDEGGFAPPLKKTSETLDLILEAVKKAGYQKNTEISLDCAATQFCNKIKSKYNYKLENKNLDSGQLLNFYQKLIDNYPIISLEDPFAEEDWQGFQDITKKLGKEITIIGDDLLVTNPKRIKIAFKEKACNGLLLKVNQIGTVSETIEAAKIAQSFDWKVMVSHRSGETRNDFIADLAVGIGAEFIKAGAPARGERVAKYNRLLRIEEELK